MAAHTPSTACLQARAARLRGRRAAGIEARLRSWGDCDGQVSIDDLLAELDQGQDSPVGGERP
jgi:hypothetical protein